MRKGLIITLPRHDKVTEYFSYFSEEILKEANKRNILYKKLIDKQVTRAEFDKVISKIDYNLIVLNGHGNPTAISGKDEKTIIVEENVNDSILGGRIVYSRACEAGASLGKSIIAKNKEGCFIGYFTPFEFYTDSTWEGNPGRDPIAPLFLTPSNLVSISILKGRTTGEAHIASKKAILKNIKKMLRNLNPDSFAIATSLWNNYEGQILHGNSEAII